MGNSGVLYVCEQARIHMCIVIQKSILISVFCKAILCFNSICKQHHLMAYIDNISVFWKLVKRDIWINLRTKNGFIETNNKAGSGREILAWRLSTKFHAVNIAASCTLRWLSLSLDSMCSRRVLPLTCYFSIYALKRCVRYALLEWQMYPCRWAIHERDFSWQQDCNRCFFFCYFNISLTIFLSTGCFFNKEPQREFILSRDIKRMFLCLACCIKPLHKI